MIIKEHFFKEQDLSLKLWLKEVRKSIRKKSIPFYIKTCIQNELTIIEKNPNYKISLKFIVMLCQYDIITWNFKNIIILSNNIKYMDEYRKDIVI